MNASELFGHWRDVRQALYQALDLLNEEHLSFRPRDGLWSLREVVCHIAEVEEGWFRHNVTREHASWVDLNPDDYPTIASLKTLLAEVHDRTEATYSNDGDRKFKETAVMPWGKTIDHAWVAWHVLEHEIHHRGEVFLMLGMLGIEAPDV